MTKVISVINYKGGVGKTTTTYHIGCSLAQHFGKRVLLVDIDPQTNLTFLCATIDRWQRFKANHGTIATMYRRYLEKQPVETKRFIWRTPVSAGRQTIASLDLIPCDIDLLGEDIGGAGIAGTFPTLEALRKQAAAYLRERAFLKTALRDVDGDYDYVLIDCPPNLYTMTQNALVASEWYLVTAIPDHLSTIGLRILGQKVTKIGEMVESAHTFAGDSKYPSQVAKLGGVVFVRVRIGGTMLTNLHWSTMGDVRRLVGDNVCFENYTTELIGYGEASEGTAPVWLHPSPNARRAAAKEEYPAITKEFLARF